MVLLNNGTINILLPISWYPNGYNSVECSILLRSEFLGHRLCIYSTLVNIAKQVSRMVMQISIPPSSMVSNIFLYVFGYLDILLCEVSVQVSCLFFFFFFNQRISVNPGHSWTPFSAGETARKSTRRRAVFLSINSSTSCIPPPARPPNHSR